MVKEIVEPDLADTFSIIEKNYLHDAFGNVFSERIRFKDDGVVELEVILPSLISGKIYRPANQ